MQYVSDAQRRFFHTMTARRNGITAAETEKRDDASRGKELPERVNAAKRSHRQKMISQHLKQS